MKYFLILLLAVGCQKKADTITESTPLPETDYTVALQFINDYNDYWYAPHADAFRWIAKNKRVTQSFKDRYKTILDSALIADPELGLGFDPVFNAQDNVEKGFEIKAIDSATGYATVRAKSAPKFEITVKVISQNGVSLVDGSGIINIPKAKQAAN